MRDLATAHLRIYVGGISTKATIENLYEHFSPCGKINGIVINRNFGFVQFETEESAQDAIAKFNGSMFNGSTITVRTAQTNVEKRYVNKCLYTIINTDKGKYFPMAK